MRRVLLAAWTCAASWACFAQDEDLAAELNSIAEAQGLMGMSVVAVCQGQTAAIHHTGFKNWSAATPVDNATKFRIASVSKAMTATAMMRLHDAGLFGWGDDVSAVLGYEVRNPQHPDVPITIDMLLSHTSSLQDGSGYAAFLSETYASSDTPSIAELLVPGGSAFTSNMWRSEPPGTYFAYANANFGLLATVMEALTGQRFDVLMRDWLFDPMGLSCSFNVSDLPDADDLATLYRNIGGSWTAQADDLQGVLPPPVDLPGYVPGTNGLRFAPQGGLRASALDLAALMNLHVNNGTFLGEELISPETMAAMRTTLHTNDGSNGDNYFGLFQSWGRGLHRAATTDTDQIFPNTGDMWGHPGEAYGLISDWYYDAETGNGVIFLTNGAWDGYSFGTQTSFYTVEEQVFAAVASHLASNCTAHVHDQRPLAEIVPYPNPAADQLHLTLPAPAQCDVRDLQGRSLFPPARFEVPGPITLDLAGLTNGPLLLVIRSLDGSDVATLPFIRLEP
jgi:CubicO group peptidase (beta-lactamase class C family)